MANGSGGTQCNNCWHFKYAEDGRSCMKYDFVLPRTTYEILCRDHRRRFLKRLVTDWRAFVTFLIIGVPAILLYVFTAAWLDDFRRIQSRKKNLLSFALYFYAYYSNNPMQPLAPFSELQAPSVLITVWVTLDKEKVPIVRLEPLTTANMPELSKAVVAKVEGDKIKLGSRGDSGQLLFLDFQRLRSFPDWPTALLYAQPETETYRLMPHPFVSDQQNDETRQ